MMTDAETGRLFMILSPEQKAELARQLEATGEPGLVTMAAAIRRAVKVQNPR